MRTRTKAIIEMQCAGLLASKVNQSYVSSLGTLIIISGLPRRILSCQEYKLLAMK